MDVRPVGPDDVGRVAAVLAAAFCADPFSRWLFGERDLERRLERSWRVQLRVVYMPKGHCYASDNLSGAALWAPPGPWKLTVGQQARLAPLYLRLLGPRRLPAAARAFAMIEHARPAEPHWYLSVLGVDPAKQRTGVGGTLLRHVLERAEVPVHLETFTPENVPYYERFGFAVTAEETIPEGPRMWAMFRR
jgi:ribosomal protein S18 acetylase RimI-like enzyme